MIMLHVASNSSKQQSRFDQLFNRYKLPIRLSFRVESANVPVGPQTEKSNLNNHPSGKKSKLILTTTREREYFGGMLGFDIKNMYLRVALETLSDGRYLTQHAQRTRLKAYPSLS